MEQSYEAETLTSTDEDEYEQLKRAFLEQSKRFMATNLSVSADGTAFAEEWIAAEP